MATLKQLFPGHFAKTQPELDRLWKSATIALDANVLLNVYRYSPRTKESLLTILEQLSDRIWVPHQGLCEFFNNRVPVISEQAEAYTKSSSAADQLLAELQGNRAHPFISDQCMKSVSQALDSLRNELEKTKESRLRLLSNDDDLDRISAIIGDSASEPDDAETLRSKHEQVKNRHERGLPPGLRDNKKSDNRPLGDGLIWLEILEKSSRDNCDIIFVTDDAKDDWWLVNRGKRLGPHPYLTKELFDASGRLVHFYSTTQFMKHGYKYLGKEIEQQVLDETQEVSDLAQLRVVDKSSQSSARRLMNRILRLNRECDKLLQALESIPPSQIASAQTPFDLPGKYIDKLDRSVLRFYRAAIAILELHNFLSQYPRFIEDSIDPIRPEAAIATRVRSLGPRYFDFLEWAIGQVRESEKYLDASENKGLVNVDKLLGGTSYFRP